MSNLLPVHANLTLTFTGTHHLGTGRAEGLLNRTVRRDARGRAYVPGTALKGALREAAERLAGVLDAQLDSTDASVRFGMRHYMGDAVAGARCHAPRPEGMCRGAAACIICRVFGNVFTGHRLIVDDAYAMADPLLTKIEGRLREHEPELTSSAADAAHGRREQITRTSIDRRRRGVRSGALFTSEFIRERVTFRGSIDGQVGQTTLDYSADGAPAELVFLAATLRFMRQVGAGASLGRGHCHVALDDNVLVAGGTRHDVDDLIRDNIEELAYLNL